MQDICQCTPFLRAKFTFHPSFSRTASICKTAKECPFSRTFIFLEKKSMFIFWITFMKIMLLNIFSKKWAKKGYIFFWICLDGKKTLPIFAPAFERNASGKSRQEAIFRYLHTHFYTRHKAEYTSVCFGWSGGSNTGKTGQANWYPFNLNRNINRESGSYFEGIWRLDSYKVWFRGFVAVK